MVQIGGLGYLGKDWRIDCDTEGGSLISKQARFTESETGPDLKFRR